MSRAPPSAHPGEAADAGPTAGIAPCPCRLLFACSLGVPSWWPCASGARAQSAHTGVSRPPSDLWFSGPLAYEYVAGWREFDDPGWADAHDCIRHLLGYRPCLKAPAGVAALYGQWQPHFVAPQDEVLRRYAAIAHEFAIRESRDHVLLSGDELVAHTERVFGIPGRLVILLLSASEAGYIAGSSSRRSRFCSWLRRLESRGLPLVIVSGVPLEGVAPEVRAPASCKLRFRSRRRPQLGGSTMLGEFMGILESADQEMLALLLGEGACRIKEWRTLLDAQPDRSGCTLSSAGAVAGVKP